MEIPPRVIKPSLSARGLMVVGVAEGTVSGSSVYATYEVVVADPNKVETVTIPVAVAFTDLPAVGRVIGIAELGPLSAARTADSTSSIPRFANVADAQEFYSIHSCPAP